MDTPLAVVSKMLDHDHFVIVTKGWQYCKYTIHIIHYTLQHNPHVLRSRDLGLTKQSDYSLFSFTSKTKSLTKKSAIVSLAHQQLPQFTRLTIL